MFIVPGFVLAAALFSDQQQSYGNLTDSPMNAGGSQSFGANDLLAQLRGIDGQMMEITKKLVGAFKGGRLLLKKAQLTTLGAQRDALIARGAAVTDQRIVQLENQFRQIVATVLGSGLTAQLEKAHYPLRARRDNIVRALGQQGTAVNWSSYGQLQRTDLFGQLRRTDLFGQLQRTDLFGDIKRTDLFGWRPSVESTDQVADAVTDEMFGQEVDDFRQDPEYQEWLTQFEEEVPLTATDQAGGLVKIAIDAFKAQVQQYIPKVYDFDVRGGQDATGQYYAKVTLSTTDPYGVLQSSATYALQAAGAHGVSVASEPSDKPNQVVLVFSQGVVPD